MTFKNLQHTPWPKRAFGYALAFFGLVTIFISSFMYGVIIIGIGSALSFREGIEVDISSLQYRKIYSLFGKYWGAYKPLPDVEYVSVLKTKLKKTVRAVSAQASFATQVYKVNLFYNTNQHLEAFVTDDREEAFKTAQLFVEALKIELHDATNE